MRLNGVDSLEVLIIEVFFALVFIGQLSVGYGCHSTTSLCLAFLVDDL
jgi:hypothetical protein